MYDMQEIGARCRWCNTWFEDVEEGYDPPGYPRFCAVCTKPTVTPGKVRKLSGSGGQGGRLNALNAAEKRRRKKWGVVFKKLGEAQLQVYENQGTDHLKYYGRFNYWPSHEKWWDSITNIKGKGAAEFVAYVQNKVTKLQLKGYRRHA